MDPDGFLAIDGGNTRLKATFFSGKDEAEVWVYPSADAEGLLRLIEELRVTRGAMVSVGYLDPRLAESLRHLLGDSFMMVTPSTKLPLKISYAHPETLGLDRKATSVAAASMYPDERVLVIDAGSALTCDIVAGNAFISGSISPGLTMRFRSLHDYTAKLPEVSADEYAVGELKAFSCDSRGAIYSGVVNGYLNEIAGDIVGAAQTVGIPDRVIFTGGDAGFIVRHLETYRSFRECRDMIDKIKITYDPHLLAKGVRAIYHYHEHEL